jgi:hypothetical protein
MILMGKRDIHDFRTWISDGGTIRDQDKYLIDGQVCVDFFIRFENLMHDINTVNEKLGLSRPDRELPRFKSGITSKRFDIPQFYDTKTEKLVRNAYAFEFDLFGYELHNAT